MNLAKLITNKKVVPMITQLEKHMEYMTLGELFSRAQEFGRIRLYQHKDRCFSFRIEFQSIPGTSLEAGSGYDHKTVESAIIAAIQKAQEIQRSFKEN